MTTPKEDIIKTLTDPSYLTTAQLLREIESLKELTMMRINEMQKAIDTAHDNLVRVPTDVQKQVGALRSEVFAEMNVIGERITGEHNLKEEKFNKVNQRFDLIEQQRVEQKKDTSDAVEKTMTSQKEAVAAQNNANQLAIQKQEATMAKQMDQLSNLINNISKGLEDKIADLKDRVTKIESIAVGVISQKSETKSNVGLVIGVIAVAASIVFGIIGFIMGHNANG